MVEARRRADSAGRVGSIAAGPVRRTAAGRALALLSVAAGVATALPISGGAAGPSPAEQPARAAVAPLAGAFTTIANGDRVTRLARDGAVVWSATEGGGLVRWDTADRTFRQYLHPQDGLPSNDVADVEVVGDGSVWVATSGGIALVDGDRVLRTYAPESSPGMPSRSATAIEPAGDGTLWVGFAQSWDPDAKHPGAARADLHGSFVGGGLARFDPGGGTWRDVRHVAVVTVPGSASETYESIPSENVTDIVRTPDGLVWVATRPYLAWEPSRCVPGEPCEGDEGYWAYFGGGLAATDGTLWRQWYTGEDGTTSCYPNDIPDLAADGKGRVWVASRGRGVLVMKDGLRRGSCSTQVRYERERFNAPGLRGLHVWAIDVDEQDRIWMGHGDGPRAGRGIAVLDYGADLDDWVKPWESDDTWSFVDFDGVSGKSEQVVSALVVHGPLPMLVGGMDFVRGDGPGVRLYDPSTEGWTPLRTADSGMPSNAIAHLARDAVRGRTWFSFRSRGVARLDDDGTWHHWLAYGNADAVVDVLADAQAGDRRLAVSLADQAEYQALFPEGRRFARVGNDPTLYAVTGFAARRGGEGPFLYVSPRLVSAVRTGAPVYRVDRGPASNASQHVAVDAFGGAWVGGQFTIWQDGDEPGTNCTKYPQCYLDGGLGHYDGERWTVFDDQNSDLPQNGVREVQVSAVEIDLAGRVWAGTGDRRSVGNGVGVLDPGSGAWTTHTYRKGMSGGDGAADFDVDEATGHVWVAHHPVAGYITLPNGQQQRYFDGGGVGRWDGGGWRSWTKPAAPLRAFGDKGILEAVLVDRGRDRVWAGGWDGDPATFHWQQGKDVDAALNWCALGDCTDAGWQAQVWPDEGTVAALALDDRGRLWAGVNRSGAGTAPPVAGIKLWDGAGWSAVTPHNSGLASHEIVALAADGRRMWIGTLARGVSLYDDRIVPTATPTSPPPATATATPSGAPTDTSTVAVPTEAATGPATGTASATEPAPTESTPTATRPTATASPTTGACPDGRCRIFLPRNARRR